MATIYGMYAMRQGEPGIAIERGDRMSWRNVRNGNGIECYANGTAQYHTTVVTLSSSLSSCSLGLTTPVNRGVSFRFKGVAVSIRENMLYVSTGTTIASAQSFSHQFGYTVARWEFVYTSTSVTLFRNNALVTSFTINTVSDNSIEFIMSMQAGQNIFFDYSSWADLTLSDERLGDVHVAYLLPNGNGASSEWLGSDGNSTDNYQLVDEHPASATDYVGTGTAGKKDSCQMSNLPAAAASVLAVQPLVFAFKSDAGVEPSVSYVLRESGGTEATGAVAGIGTTMAGISSSIHHTKPSGGAWSVSDVNSMEAGITT